MAATLYDKIDGNSLQSHLSRAKRRLLSVPAPKYKHQNNKKGNHALGENMPRYKACLFVSSSIPVQAADHLSCYTTTVLCFKPKVQQFWVTPVRVLAELPQGVSNNQCIPPLLRLSVSTPISRCSIHVYRLQSTRIQVGQQRFLCLCTASLCTFENKSNPWPFSKDLTYHIHTNKCWQRRLFAKWISKVWM